jgi:hypothetical protein
LIYYANNPLHFNVKLFFVPTHDIYSIALLNYYVTYGITDTQQKVRLDIVLYLVPWFYKKSNYSLHEGGFKTNEIYLLWFFYYKIALCGWWNNLYDTELNRGFYIVLLVLWSKIITATEKHITFSLFWFIHKYVALFHFSTDKREGNHIKPVDVDDITIDVELNHAKTVFKVPNVEYTGTDYLTYLCVLFYIEKKATPYSFKIALFWFFLRQVAFIRLTREFDLIKYVIFPFFKYYRKSGKFTKWCLLPFVPIKYSFIANVLVYEKKVHKLGILNDVGEEDKKTRVQDKYVRILYRVARWQTESGITTVEINPWWSYERRSDENSRETSFRTWDCLGGIFGKKKKGTGKDQTRVCCFWYC